MTRSRATDSIHVCCSSGIGGANAAGASTAQQPRAADRGPIRSGWRRRRPRAPCGRSPGSANSRRDRSRACRSRTNGFARRSTASVSIFTWNTVCGLVGIAVERRRIREVAPAPVAELRARRAYRVGAVEHAGIVRAAKARAARRRRIAERREQQPVEMRRRRAGSAAWCRRAGAPARAAPRSNRRAPSSTPRAAPRPRATARGAARRR